MRERGGDSRGERSFESDLQLAGACALEVGDAGAQLGVVLAGIGQRDDDALELLARLLELARGLLLELAGADSDTCGMTVSLAGTAGGGVWEGGGGTDLGRA